MAALTAALLSIALLASTAGADTSPSGVRFQAYPTCDVFVVGRPERDTSCVDGDAWGAVLVWHEPQTRRYHICIRRPDRTHDCYKRRSAAYGEPTVDGFFHQSDSRAPGLYRFTWRMHGQTLDRDVIRLRLP